MDQPLDVDADGRGLAAAVRLRQYGEQRPVAAGAQVPADARPCAGQPRLAVRAEHPPKGAGLGTEPGGEYLPHRPVRDGVPRIARGPPPLHRIEDRPQFRHRVGRLPQRDRPDVDLDELAFGFQPLTCRHITCSRARSRRPSSGSYSASSA
ncbi:MAG TPA: hypothetical protein VGL02_13440 [Streptomyces sp.]